MGMTITEKILARAAGKEKVTPGELIDASIDIVMCVDVTTPPAISMLEEKGLDKVFDRDYSNFTFDKRLLMTRGSQTEPEQSFSSVINRGKTNLPPYSKVFIISCGARALKRGSCPNILHYFLGQRIDLVLLGFGWASLPSTWVNCCALRSKEIDDEQANTGNQSNTNTAENPVFVGNDPL